MKITSPDFKNGERLPDICAYQNENYSPALEWTDVPEETSELVMICDDPDAPMGTWVHWVVYGIPNVMTKLPQNIPKLDSVPKLGGAYQGKNDFGNVGYDGPAPPPGPDHRYFFKVYALNETLNLDYSATKQQLEEAMQGKILADAEIIGTYSS